MKKENFIQCNHCGYHTVMYQTNWSAHIITKIHKKNISKQPIETDFTPISKNTYFKRRKLKNVEDIYFCKACKVWLTGTDDIIEHQMTEECRTKRNKGYICCDIPAYS